MTSVDKPGGRGLEDVPALSDELAPGSLVGEYRIEGKIGEGGFGKVYHAIHPVIGKRAAIKVLNREYSANPSVVSRFVSEARAVNQIRHRNIIDIFSFGTLEGGLQYFVMELLDGLTLDSYLEQRGRLRPEEAIVILRYIARALDAAHEAGIAHRDMKPENVFLSYDDEGGMFPKLLDFGIAKLMGDESVSHKTRTGAAMGTPLYMSPEQCHGKNVDHRTDIYSFGVMTHEMLTGRCPFDGDSMMELMLKHVQEPPPALSQICPELPAGLDGPVLRMLAKKPEDRPQSLVAAVAELTAAAQQAGLTVPSRGTYTGSQKSMPGVGAFAGTSSRTGRSNPELEGAATAVMEPERGAAAVSAATHSHPESPLEPGRAVTQQTMEAVPQPPSTTSRAWLFAFAIATGVGVVLAFVMRGDPPPAEPAPAEPAAVAPPAEPLAPDPHAEPSGEPEIVPTTTPTAPTATASSAAGVPPPPPRPLTARPPPPPPPVVAPVPPPPPPTIPDDLEY